MSSLPVTSRPNLIVGCGYLGRRVARRWLAAGRRVVALTRHNAPTLAAIGIEPVLGNVLDPQSLTTLPSATTVLYAVGGDRSASKTQREVTLSGLGHLLDALPPCERFIYVSSTGVYAQTQGEFVDETSPTEPGEESGRVALDAEQLLSARRPDAIILRFAGIYGPDRLLRKQPVLAGEPLVGDADRWLNLIHVKDGADAILATESSGTSGETYNVADDEPVPRRAFYTLLAELLGGPPATFDHRPVPGEVNRRIRNGKAKTALGWQPRFPSYREGLPAAVKESVR